MLGTPMLLRFQISSEPDTNASKPSPRICRTVPQKSEASMIFCEAR